MKRLIAFISIMMLVSGALATATSITIYGTNKSNAQTNVTCYGCNNTISVQAWNTSYIKNISVNSLNASGDVVSFNISNVTGYQVQELKVNGTAVNGYQAGANGMLNFSYTVTGNKTLTLAPAVKTNGYNMTWLYIWNSRTTTTFQNVTSTRASATVYQNTNNSVRYVIVSGQQTASTLDGCYVGAVNPPTNLIVLATTAGLAQAVTVPVPYQYYYKCVLGAGIASWLEVGQ